MKNSVLILLFFSIVFTSSPSISMGASRVDSVVEEDTTERLENIALLKKSLRELNIELGVLNTALVQAKKKRSHKKLYVTTKKIADAITAITVLGGTIASYRYRNKLKIMKIGSLIGGLTASTSVLSSLAADLSDDEAAALKVKLEELQSIIRASNINLNKEIKLLCKQEPSNQMCL